MITMIYNYNKLFFNIINIQKKKKNKICLLKFKHQKFNKTKAITHYIITAPAKTKTKTKTKQLYML